jgi:hypothetical protein
MVRSSEDVVAPASQEIWRLLWDRKGRGRVPIMKILIILFCLRSFYFLLRRNKILFGIRFSKNFNLLCTSLVARDRVHRPLNTERTGNLSYPFAWFGSHAVS